MVIVALMFFSGLRVLLPRYDGPSMQLFRGQLATIANSIITSSVKILTFFHGRSKDLGPKIDTTAGAGHYAALAVGFDIFSAMANIPNQHGRLSCAQESGS